MPVKDRAQTVGRAIESVLRQDFADFELIVVDDGSDDGTADVVCSVLDPRLRLIALDQSRGSNAARNAGIRAAGAPLIAFLDSDDEYLPNKLGFVTGFFTQHPNVDVLVDSFVKLTERGGRTVRANRTNPTITDQEKFRRALYTRRLWKATPAISVRKAAAERAGLFDESLKRLQDFDLLARLSEKGACVATDQLLWVKHDSSHSISSNTDTFIRSYIELVRRHPQFLANPAYRPGLARDVARHIWRLVVHGRLSRAATELRQLADAFGWRRTSALMIEGHRSRPPI